jgi:DNA-binding transcriptional LysR family regulator
LRDLREEPWITGTPGGCCATITSAVCAGAGFAPRVAHRVDDWHAVTQLVRGGHGVALMPRLAQSSMPQDVAIRPVHGPSPQRHLFAAIREGGQGTQMLTAVLDHLRQHRAS